MTTQQHSDVLRTGTWHIDPAKTTVTVAVKKLGMFTVTAGLNVTAGTISLGNDDNTVEVDVTVDAASYASPMAKRNEHVRGAHFLDTEHNPTIRFTGGTLASDAAGNYRVAGDVTIKGRKSPVEFRVTDIDASTDVASFKATASVDRKSVGIDKMPSFIIGKTLNLTVTAYMNR
ncbi:MAG: YceI family protein [Acidimicrobiia bacterium]|nr:YceI family protein [Acidimicrobiia bacterium]